MTDTHTLSPVMKDILALRELPVAALRERYLALFGEETTSRNKDWLFKRLAYRMQEQRYGGLSQKAVARTEALAAQAPIRRRSPRNVSSVTIVEESARDPRLPPVGTVLRREFKGVVHEVRVLTDGFEYRGERFTSLSTLATRIAGARWNGFTFFRIGRSA
ncbi:MAG: DUF2924 domain-containing protein [Kofleriaceae bacterium]